MKKLTYKIFDYLSLVVAFFIIGFFLYFFWGFLFSEYRVSDILKEIPSEYNQTNTLYKK